MGPKSWKIFALPTAAYIEIFEIDPKYFRDNDLENRISGVSRFDYGQNQLNRKFKLAFSAIHYDDVNKKCVPDNCVELRTNDIGIAPVIKYHDSIDGISRYTKNCRFDEKNIQAERLINRAVL